MRHIILLDNKIPLSEYEAWVKEDSAFWKEHLGITPTYFLIRTDYIDYPTYFDEDGDIRATVAYLQGLTTSVVKTHGEFAFDFIMVMVHPDNWKSSGTYFKNAQKNREVKKAKGIWGTNYSYIFGKQCLDYCLWDSKNSANTFGTAYHERHHSFDAIIKVETGVDIQPILGVTAYDHQITHGNLKPWKYIRHKENLESLRIMKPYLVKALDVRRAKHEEIVTGMMKTIIKLGTQLLYMLTIERNKKYGVPQE